MISVIVPVYNSREYLNRCIDSILEQTYKDFEVLIVDDGSTDGSRDIIENFAGKDSRVRIVDQNHSGVALARNNGIKNALGQMIAFIDSDDYVDSDYLEKLKKGIDEGADISYCRTNFEDENLNFLSASGDDLSRMIKCADYDWNGTLQHPTIWGALFKKETVEGISFDNEYYVGEDSIYWSCCLKKASMLYYVHDTKYHYIRYDQSALHGSFDEKKYTELLAWRKIYESWNIPAVAMAYGTRIMRFSRDHYSSSVFREVYLDQTKKEFRRIYFAWIREARYHKNAVKAIIGAGIFAISPELYFKKQRFTKAIKRSR